MSWQPAADAVCAEQKNCDPVELVIRPVEHELGGFTVRRTLPTKERPMVGPFIFFDQMGPASLPAETPINVRPHPHIGLATLTWLWEGAILHRDSLGYKQEIQPGAINWMTAGKGIVHSERTPEHLLGQPTRLFGLQVWMALPQSHEEVDPSFQHYPADQVPVIDADGMTAQIVAGTAWGTKAPVSVYSDTLYVDIRLQDGAKITIDKEHEERAVYALAGGLEIGGQTFQPGEMAILEPGRLIDVKAVGTTHFVLIGGSRMDGPRYKFWNFVSSSRERINQAKKDWKEGRFATVPGDEKEFIPLPTL